MADKKSRLLWFDLIRGISALFVVASHFRNAMFVDYAEAQPSLFNKVFYLLTGFGHQAVVVFFVLSGFFVGGSVLANRSTFKLSDYFNARLSRLWIVLVPAMGLTWLVDQLSLLVRPDIFTGAFNQLLHSGPVVDAYSVSLVTFLGNVFFLQTIFVPVFGSNDPLWSLANEFWYYVLFPMLAIACGALGQYRVGWKRVGAVLVFTFTLFLSMPPGFWVGFFIWTLGVIVWLYSEKEKPGALGKFARLGCLLVFVISLLSTKLSFNFTLWSQARDFLLGIGVLVLCISLLGLPFTKRLQKTTVFISESSYSLYLFHFPFVMLVGASVDPRYKLQPTSGALVMYFGILGATIAGAFAFWWAFERNTPWLRSLMRRVLPKR